MQKHCEICNKVFTRPYGYSKEQWQSRRTCSRTCSSKLTATLLRGRKQGEETLKKKSIAQKAKWLDPVERAKRTEAITNKMNTESYKANHRASLRKYFDNPDNKQAVLDRIARANKTKFTPNPHRTRGDVTYIYFANDKGFTKVDTVDYEDLAKYRWVHMARGYAEATVNGKRTLLHRYLMKPEGRKEVDHINHDRLDNRKSNLRIATRSQNARNVSRGKSNTSGYKGVHYVKQVKRYRAVIWYDNERKHLGYFDTAELAAEAYRNAADEYHGDYANY